MALTNKQLIAIAVTIVAIVVSIWYYRNKNKPIKTSTPSATVTPTSISTPSTPVALTLIPINNPSPTLQSMQQTDSDLSPIYRRVLFSKPDITVDQVKEILTKYPKVKSPYEITGDLRTPTEILNLTVAEKISLLNYALKQLNNATTKTMNTNFELLTDRGEINNGNIYLNNLKNAIDNVNKYLNFYNIK